MSVEVCLHFAATFLSYFLRVAAAYLACWILTRLLGKPHQRLAPMGRLRTFAIGQDFQPAEEPSRELVFASIFKCIRGAITLKSIGAAAARHMCCPLDPMKFVVR